ncbi:MAG: hypothetical protein B6D41_22325 [Chloroflexi bacterium UTCFX4]|nr:MAG: hypothetical protein B6D41_22325 [Chloroflexi bacterium UTCFX4]
MASEIDKFEEATFNEDDSDEVPPIEIVAYNELRSCADLFRMKTQEILDIQPEFQREIVWSDPSQTRFIDSLIKQLPIPSMCFSLDYKTQKWQVIDGLQRISSIIRFLSAEDWTLSKLDDIDPKISGKPISKFLDKDSELHLYYTRVENLTLPITVIRCDYSKKTHTNYLFTIFHRLNTGGMKLNNQEIRNCIYSGELNNLLRRLNKNQKWMKLNKMSKDTGYRFTKQELILRFFAFYDKYEQYNGRLAKFLNDYMADHRSPSPSFVDKKTEIFNRVVDLVYGTIFAGRIPTKLGISVLEAILVGVARNLEYVEKLPAMRVKAMYSRLLEQEEFSDEKLREGLAGRARVISRLNAATSIFAGD